MKTLAIQAVARAEYGKKATKSVRREGMIPCVLYGAGENVAFSIDEKAVKPLIYTPNSYIVEIDIEGKVEKAVLREVQFHPIREQILHIDFYRVQEDKPVSIAIPVTQRVLRSAVSWLCRLVSSLLRVCWRTCLTNSLLMLLRSKLVRPSSLVTSNSRACSSYRLLLRPFALSA